MGWCVRYTTGLGTYPVGGEGGREKVVGEGGEGEALGIPMGWAHSQLGAARSGESSRDLILFRNADSAPLWMSYATL